jgi:hypothetical protein
MRRKWSARLVNRSRARERSGSEPFRPVQPGEDEWSRMFAYLSWSEKDVFKKLIEAEVGPLEA